MFFCQCCNLLAIENSTPAVKILPEEHEQRQPGRRRCRPLEPVVEPVEFGGSKRERGWWWWFVVNVNARQECWFFHICARCELPTGGASASVCTLSLPKPSWFVPQLGNARNISMINTVWLEPPGGGGGGRNGSDNMVEMALLLLGGSSSCALLPRCLYCVTLFLFLFLFLFLLTMW
jgi:hypothetical protein